MISPALDSLLTLLCAVACAVYGAAGIARMVKRGGSLPRNGLLVGLLLALLLLSWAHRFALVGHLPIFGTYESALSLALFTMAMAFIYEWRQGFTIGIGPPMALISAALLLHARLFDATGYALTISERSLVVDLHAVLAWWAFGALAVNGALALISLLRRRPMTTALVGTLKLGFALHSGMMVSGSLYQLLLFGRAWSFDPMELLGFVVWMAYGILLHLALMAGWRGLRLARWCLFVFVLLVASYRLIVYFPGWSSYHILDVDLRVHIPR